MATKNNTRQQLRFVIVGVMNTAIDFGLFLALATMLPYIAANFISTTIALTFSFIVNRRYTFRGASHKGSRQIVLFLAVTLCGLWAIQPAIFWLFGHFAGELYTPFATTLLTKIAATGCTLIWNYLWYSKVVFRKTPAPASSLIQR